MYVYIYTHIYTHIYTYMFKFTCTSLFLPTCLPTYLSIFLYLFTYAFISFSVCLSYVFPHCLFLSLSLCVYIDIHVYVYMYISICWLCSVHTCVFMTKRGLNTTHTNMFTVYTGAYARPHALCMSTYGSGKISYNKAALPAETVVLRGLIVPPPSYVGTCAARCCADFV